jgi:hypothetical protein
MPVTVAKDSMYPCQMYSPSGAQASFISDTRDADLAGNRAGNGPIEALSVLMVKACQDLPPRLGDRSGLAPSCL